MYRPTISDVLNGREISPVTLREECMLRAFENRVLILRPEMEEVTQEYKILHNYELQYSGVPRNEFSEGRRFNKFN
jgi:hypothetical protein